MRWVPFSLSLLLVAAPCSADSAARVTLSNGLRTIVQPVRSTEVVAIELLFDIAAHEEPRGQDGIRYLTQRLLLRGTEHMSGDAMGRRLAAVGGIADATVGLDYVELYALVPADGFETALALLADCVQFPRFAPEEVARQRNNARELASAAREEPFQETYLAFREGLYGSHPYGRHTIGRPRSLAAITAEDISAFHARRYVPNRAVLAVAGGVSRARAMQAIRAQFETWPPGEARSWLPPPVPELTFSQVVARERPLHRAHVILGFPAPAAEEAGYYACQVLDTVLGGGVGARLPRRIREELALVYQVSSFHPTLAQESHLGIYAATEPFHVGDVKDAVLRLLRDLAEHPVSQDELTRAKSYLLGSYALSHQRMKEQAYALAWYELLGLGVDFEGRYRREIEAVSAVDVQQAAEQILQHFVLAVTMPTS